MVQGGRCDLKKTLFSNKKAFEIFITYFDSNRNKKILRIKIS